MYAALRNDDVEVTAADGIREVLAQIVYSYSFMYVCAARCVCVCVCMSPSHGAGDMAYIHVQNG